VKPLHCEVSFTPFTAQTPVEPSPCGISLRNFPGKSGRAIVITGHFDSKPMPGHVFLGANDGGSSTGFLLEMARVVNSVTHLDDIYLVWFDGEEAFGEWSDTTARMGAGTWRKFGRAMASCHISKL